MVTLRGKCKMCGTKFMRDASDKGFLTWDFCSWRCVNNWDLMDRACEALANHIVEKNPQVAVIYNLAVIATRVRKMKPSRVQPTPTVSSRARGT